MNEDTLYQLSTAKIQIDKYDVLTEVIVVPHSWKERIAQLSAKGVTSVRDGKLTIWGNVILFGDVEEPVAASSWNRGGGHVLDFASPKTKEE